MNSSILRDEDVHAVRYHLVHDDRIVPIVFRPVRCGELRCAGRHRRDRLEDVVRLEFRSEALADPLVLVLLDFAQADRMRALLMLKSVKPVEDVPDVSPNHGRCLAMNQDVGVEENPHWMVIKQFISKMFDKNIRELFPLPTLHPLTK